MGVMTADGGDGVLTFRLVHGGCNGGMCWWNVRPRLLEMRYMWSVILCCHEQIIPMQNTVSRCLSPDTAVSP